MVHLPRVVVLGVPAHDVVDRRRMVTATRHAAAILAAPVAALLVLRALRALVLLALLALGSRVVAFVREVESLHYIYIYTYIRIYIYICIYVYIYIYIYNEQK